MFYRRILSCLFLLGMGCVAACDREETKTAVSSPTPIKPFTATPMATKTNVPQPTHDADPTPTAKPQQTPTSLPQPTANPPTETPAGPTKTPSPSPTSVYNPGTIFSTSLSMSEQCTATNNTYYLRYADRSELIHASTIVDRLYFSPIQSPDGQAQATLDLGSSNSRKIIVTNTDGRVFEDILVDKRISRPDTSEIWSMTRWLQDKRTLFYVKGQIEDDTYLPMLYDSEIGVARPLLTTGVSSEPPVFTTDYSQVFLVHQIGSDAWIKAVAIDGSSERILVDDAFSAEQLTLFNDGRHLAYAIWRNQGWQIELVDIETGQRQLLQDNLKQVLNITFDFSVTFYEDSDTITLSWVRRDDTITIWWVRQDDTTGVSSYSSDGHLFYQLEIERPLRKVATEFWSPNGETAVIKLDGGNGEAVVLAYPDDRESVVVRNGLSGLGDPYWSPDSQLFAFTQLVIPLISEGIDLEIVDTVGNTLWSYSPFPLSYRTNGQRTYGKNTLEWVACP